MDLREIKAVVAANRAAGRSLYEGLDSAEIGAYNRALMIGDDDEAFPGVEAWARIVD